MRETEEIAFPVGVPSLVAVRLGIMVFSVTGRTTVFFVAADTLFAFLRGSMDRSAVTGKSQIGKQHGYPEFLKDRVFRIATEIGQSDFSLMSL